jgi:hypothetical protein
MSDRPEIFGIVKHLDRWIDKFFLNLTIFTWDCKPNCQIWFKSGFFTIRIVFLFEMELQFKLKIELIFDLN